MSGWSMLIYGSVAFVGGVCFLRLVSNAVADAQGVMQALEERELKLYKQRVEADELMARAAARRVTTEQVDGPSSVE